MKSLPSIEDIKKLVNKRARPFRSKLPKKREETMIIDKLPAYFLLALLLVSLYLLFEVLRPFISVIFLGIVLVAAFYPVHKWILKKVGGRENLAALFSMLFVVLLIIVPITVFGIMLTNEAIDTYQLIQNKVESGVFDDYLKWEDGGYLFEFKKQIDPFVDLNALDIKDSIVNAAQSLSTFLFDQTANFLRSISTLLLNLVMLLFAMFYFFRDGERLVKKAGDMSPLPSLYEDELFRKLDSMVKAIVYGVFLTAIAQGLVGGIGFAIIGLPSPIFWGAAMAFFSMIPMVGTAAIWFPGVVILLLLGDYSSALFLFIWGAGVTGSVDNFVRPYLIGGRANTYPLMTFFVILGGVFTMGIQGIIVGPLVLMLVMSLLHIYEAEYKKVLKK